MGSPDGPVPPLRVYFLDGIIQPLVFGTGIVALLLIITGFVNQDGFVMLMSLIPMAVAGYHLPMRLNDRPQLIIDDDGLFVEGLGSIIWLDITDIDLRAVTSDDPDSVPELVITTRESIEYTIEPQADLTIARTFQVMVWRLEELNVLRIRLHTLNVDPDFLFAEVRRRLRRSRNWAL